MCWMGANQSKNTGPLSLNSDLFRYQVIGELVQEKKIVSGKLSECGD